MYYPVTSEMKEPENKPIFTVVSKFITLWLIISYINDRIII